MKDSQPHSRKLPARQVRFCEPIAAGANQTDAWLKAGYRVSRAIEMDCRMAGHFEPEKVEVATGTSNLASLEERAKKVVSALNAWANRSTLAPRTTGLALPFASTGTPVANRGPDGSGG